MMSPAQFALQQAGFTVPQQATGAPGSSGFVRPPQGQPMMTAPAGGMKRKMEGPAGGGFSSVDALRDEVKRLQRSEPNAKEQWYSWCEQYGQDKRDPAKHSEEFLQTFLSSYKTGMRLPGEAEGLKIENVTKALQRRSRTFKDVWQKYCDVQGGGKHDPSKHQSQYHMEFYNFLSTTVTDILQCLAEGQDISSQISEETPVIKRLRMLPGLAPSALPDHAVAVPGVAKEALVQQIKAYQRMGTEQKQCWENYCDTQLRGVRDPNRHDTNALLQFALSIVEDDGSEEQAYAQQEVGTASARWKRATEAASAPPLPVSIDPDMSY